jgi:C4-dicarboxylate-specific signal transduction histidine kinase
VRTHQFVLARRHGSWDVVETAALKRAKAEIKGLNEELEKRVVERTNQLMQASEALREAQAELAHINRVTAMGQLAASITHEVNQPLTAMITNADVGLRWLDRQPPNVDETGRRSTVLPRTASAPVKSSAGSVLSSGKSLHGRMILRSTKSSWKSLP